jgi:predicted glycosyltransferase involved in capsule biosynthesis
MNNTINSKPLVSLIIACYKQASYLEKILISLLKQSFKEFEIIIADDGSGKELSDVINIYTDKYKYPVKHVWHEDIGFRKTIIVNQAVRNSNSDYLVFIDGDCILHHRFIERHYKRRKLRQVLSGRRIMFNEELTGKLTNEKVYNLEFEMKKFWWKNCDPKDRNRGLYLPFIYKIVNLSSRKYWTFGSNFSIHKQDFIDVNGYEENITGRGLEDINLSERLELKGYRIMKLTNEALQYHLFHKSGPVPHSKEEMELIIHPANYYAVKGINN